MRYSPMRRGLGDRARELFLVQVFFSTHNPWKAYVTENGEIYKAFYDNLATQRLQEYEWKYILLYFSFLQNLLLNLSSH